MYNNGNVKNNISPQRFYYQSGAKDKYSFVEHVPAECAASAAKRPIHLPSLMSFSRMQKRKGDPLKL
jgi:hypothetical protein